MDIQELMAQYNVTPSRINTTAINSGDSSSSVWGEYDKEFGTSQPQQSVLVQDVSLNANTPVNKTYAEKVAARREAEPKVIRALGDFGVGIGKSIGNTVVGVAELGNKIIDKVDKPVVEALGGTYQSPLSQQEIQEARSIFNPLNKAEKVGNTIGSIAQYLVPSVGAEKAELAIATKFPNIYANLFGKLGTKAITQGATNAGAELIMSGGDTKKAAETGLITGAIPVVGAGIKPAANLVGGALKRGAGVITGKGTNVIDQIVSNPRAAIEGLSQKPMETLTKDYTQIKNAIRGVSEAAKKEYGDTLKKIGEVVTTPIKSAKTEALAIIDNSGVKLTKQGGKKVLDFSGTPLSPNEENIVTKVYNTISGNKDLSANGVENLAQKLQKFVRGSEDSKQVDTIVKGAIKALRDSVAKEAEKLGYTEGANLARNYAIAQDKLDVYEKLFAVTDGKLSTELEKTNATKKLTNLLSGEKTIEGEKLKELGVSDVLSREAGRTMREGVTRASASLGDFISGAINTVIPPKTIGYIAAYTGLSLEKAALLAKELAPLNSVAKAAILEAISNNNN